VDLSAWLLARTPPRPLVVAVPGGTAVRLAVERVVRERGWMFATSPAEANMLVVAGPATDEVALYVERLWVQLPAPRARVDARSADSAQAGLDVAVARLCDVEHQRRLATPEPVPLEQHGHDAHGGHDDMHGHGMAMPGNVPMADRAEDRDGLTLDRLHVPLGPLLPDWPAGLVVRTTLQGDVIQQATVEVLHGRPDTFWSTAVGNTARTLDSCARLLSLAGWADASTVARRLRDAALSGTPDTGLAARWARRVRRSRTLRWLLAGVGATPAGSSTPSDLRGDALARLHRWLESSPEPVVSTQWTLDNLPAMLAGSELATARLIVASLDPDPAAMETHHG
jgi:hypothetical protein